MTLVFGIEIVRVTVLVFGLAIFLANATKLLLVLNISSNAAHFVSSFTRSISLRITFNDCCISCSVLLFIKLFSNSQIGVRANHYPTSVVT